MQCAYIGCNRTASQLVDANDGTKNKYPACDLHSVDLCRAIAMQGMESGNSIAFPRDTAMINACQEFDNIAPPLVCRNPA